MRPIENKNKEQLTIALAILVSAIIAVGIMSYVNQRDKPMLSDQLYDKGESLTQRAFGETYNETLERTDRLLNDPRYNSSSMLDDLNSLKVDKLIQDTKKLIEDTKKNDTIDQSYRQQILNRIYGTDCIY
jgi:hypothetical protein